MQTTDFQKMLYNIGKGDLSTQTVNEIIETESLALRFITDVDTASINGSMAAGLKIENNIFSDQTT